MPLMLRINHAFVARRDRRRGRPLAATAVVFAAAVPLFPGCGPDGRAPAHWAGTVDTLPSGHVVVRNPAEPSWAEGEGWTVTEDLRIGRLDAPGPYEFGQVISIDVDGYGRIWVLESQAKEVRVFDASGAHVRTVGGGGGGPGEFAGPAHAEFGPEGRLWVADPQNNRVSVIDTTGAFVEEHRMDGGFFMSPWPGGFDTEGRYYLPTPDLSDPSQFRIANVRHGPGLVPIDTLPQLDRPFEPEQFELTTGSGGSWGGLIATVPYTPGFRQFRSPRGTLWGLLTGEYRFFEVSAAGDTLRTVHARYDPIPVTAEDREAARQSLSWFTDQGGKIDLSRLPDAKPAANSLFVDDRGHIWVDRVSDLPNGQRFDIFDPSGRFLGPVELPAPLASVRLVVDGAIYGVTRDDLGVPYVVRARIDD